MFVLGLNCIEKSLWGRSVRFGGLQWATNFATQPEFIAFPLPAISGEALLPSTVEGAVYLNGLTGPTTVEASWTDGHCAAAIDASPPGDPLPDLGRVLCREIAP